MKVFFFYHLLLAFGCMFYASGGKTQSPAGSPSFSPGLPSSKKGLFASDKVLDLTLKGNIRSCLNDRDSSKNHSLVLSFRNEDSSEISIPVKVKTRGNFRRLKENCFYPPLLIRFPKKSSQKPSVFREQEKLKLVMPCNKDDEFVIREWLVYKLYNLVTPKSFRTRLVRIKLEDAGNKKKAASFYGILLEEERQLAKRNKAISVNRRLKPEQTRQHEFLTMAVFQYLIGNTDWSVQYLQNIKLLATDSTAVPVTVPYDFDHAGLVDAPYARPAEELLMSSVRERRYRGYCVKDLKIFEKVIEEFNHLKKKIYALYTSCSFLNAKYIKTTSKYLDEFYETINNPKTWRKEFSYPCDKNGTGNVVIKGLKED